MSILEDSIMPWRIQSRIGTGSFGEVFKLMRDDSGKPFFSALKVIHVPYNVSEIRQLKSEGMEDASITSFFKSQALTLMSEITIIEKYKGTSHIVSYEDHMIIPNEEGGFDICMRMELLESLTNNSIKRSLSESETVKLGIHICEALELLERDGVIHRDIKPDNIFINAFGDYKLGDFGIARHIEGTMAGLSTKGTYTYMAPEVYKREKYGTSVDQYSLGIVMYRYLNKGRMPFSPEPTHESRDKALYRRLGGEQLPTLNDVSPNLCAIVLKACEYDKKNRYGSIKDMRQALNRLDLEDLPVEPDKPVEPVKSVKSDKPVEPVKSVKLIEPIIVVDSDKPIEPDSNEDDTILDDSEQKPDAPGEPVLDPVSAPVDDPASGSKKKAKPALFMVGVAAMLAIAAFVLISFNIGKGMPNIPVSGGNEASQTTPEATAFAKATALAEATVEATEPAENKMLAEATEPEESIMPEETTEPEEAEMFADAITPSPAVIIREKGAEINVYLGSTPDTIDPSKGSTLDGGNYIAHMFEGLMRYTWDGSGVELGMAESYAVSNDGMVWTFKLRDSLWSDGQPVTADDFVFSWRRLVDPGTESPYAVDMGGFVKNGAAIAAGELAKEKLGVRAIDAKTVEVTLENPCPFFEQIAAFATFSPLRQDTIEANGVGWTRTGATYLTNGAFRMESYQSDGKMAVIPHDGYWDTARVKPAKINWMFLVDDNAVLKAFNAGELDYVDRMIQEEAVEFDGIFGKSVGMSSYYVCFNTVKEPLNNVNVRKALALAIDTKHIAETVLKNTVIAAEAFVGNGFSTSGLNEPFRSNWRTYVSPVDYTTNKEAAKAALAEAGYPNGEGFPRLEYLYNGNTDHAEALQKMWKDVLGIEVTLKSADWGAALQAARSGNFDITINGWIADYKDPVTMLNLFISTSGINDGKYNNPAFDAKIDASYKESDPAKRNQLLHEAEDLLIGQDWAIAPVYHYQISWTTAPSLKGWSISPLGYKFFQQAYKE
ncbi:MAG: ABC transporter substrate-binding protein [Clostridiales bacterium]|nr:ABC transporter substrate-binding protein [Clostridiales bacterium]